MRCGITEFSYLWLIIKSSFMTFVISIVLMLIRGILFGIRYLASLVGIVRCGANQLSLTVQSMPHMATRFVLLMTTFLLLDLTILFQRMMQLMLMLIQF